MDLTWALSRLALAVLLTGCAARRPQAAITGGEPGSVPFRNYCAACHQYDGQGMGDAPPLAGSPWVAGLPDRLIKIVLHGVQGPMEISGKVYDREMPGFAPVMDDAEIASLLSFVRRRFGGSRQPIEAADVSRVRAAHSSRSGYWHVDELK